MGTQPLHELSFETPEGDLRVIIETLKGSRNKYAYDEDLGLFVLRGVLPEGASFPFDFGMLPSTRGGDGDPLDILLLMDAPAFPGCVVTARLVGAIKAEQRERDGTWCGNDRLIGVATPGRAHAAVHGLSDLRPGLLDEIEAFFEHYNRLAGKDFRPKGRVDAQGAWRLVREAAGA